MAEDMVFLPKQDVLTLEEMLKVSEAFIERGVRRIRLTGGEPLIRKGVLDFILAERKKKRISSMNLVNRRIPRNIRIFRLMIFKGSFFRNDHR